MLVIARAYKDRPLVRTVVGTARTVIFLHNQDASEANGPVDKSGIGFPRDCVFAFDDAVYRALDAEWRAGDFVALSARWGGLEPIGELTDA